MVPCATNWGNREGLMIDRWFSEIELAISFDQFEKLPTNPAYKYEYIDGKAWLSPRPKECHALLDLPSWKSDPIGSAVMEESIRIRALESADWESLATLFAGAFQRVQPFASLSDADRLEAARDCLRFTCDGGDGPVIEPACFVAVDQEDNRLRGAILLTLMPDVDLSDSLDLRWRVPPPPDWAEQRIGRPHLTWIFVGHWSGEQGLGSSLLAATVGALRHLGYQTLASTFLLGNDASVLWHWRNGFQLVGRPHSLRKLREQSSSLIDAARSSSRSLSLPSRTPARSIMQDFEKLGLFYLGRSYDLATQKAEDDLILYDVARPGDARRLRRHDGQRQDGSLHQPAGRGDHRSRAGDRDRPEGRPVEPAADLSRASRRRLRPVGRRGRGRKEGLTAAEFAEAQADALEEGSCRVGTGRRPDRASCARAGEFRIYTPGSQAGLPISILKSFAAPPQAIRDDAEALGERVGTTATSLLGLLGVDADPMQSREHILISNILASAWKAGNDLELAALIPLIQNPPFRRVGVIDLESFFPAKDRFALALRLNNLLAAPGFEIVASGRAARRRRSASRPRRQAAGLDRLDRPPGRSGADVLRLALAQRGPGLGAHPAGHDQPACAAVHGRDLRLLPARRDPALEASAADAVEAGPRVRTGSGAGDPESRRPRLQGAVEHRHLVHRPAPGRARQAPRAGRPGRRSRGAVGPVRSRRRWTGFSRAWASARS